MTTKKTTLALITAGTLALGMIPLTSMAVPINGAISFYGDVTPYSGPTGNGSVTPTFTGAESLVFGLTQVSSGSGSFASITSGTTVTMTSPLGIPPTLNLPLSAPLWSVGGYSFTLMSLMSPMDTANVLLLSGTGTISDGNPLDTVTGTWNAGFTAAPSGVGVTFSFNASSQTVPSPVVPDSGASLMFMALGLAGLGAFAKVRKNVIA